MDTITGNPAVRLLALIAAIKLILSILDATPLKIPKRWKPVVALFLGIALAILNLVALGVPWPAAIVDGVAGWAAVGLHETQEAVTGKRFQLPTPTGADKAAPPPTPES